ncbi:MAG: hydrogenase, partial [bacterium]
MIYKVIQKSEFRKFVNYLMAENQTFGPKRVDFDKRNKPIYQYVQVYSYDEMDLDHTITCSSVKNFFLPFREELSRFEFNNGDWNQKIEYRVNPRVIIGVRPCDINALAIMDKVFINGAFPSPYYITRRKNTFLIGMDHIPLDDCFCESLNQHAVRRGFNIFCSDIGGKYYLTINSSKAFNFLKNVKTSDPAKADDKKFIERRKLIKKSFKT